MAAGLSFIIFLFTLLAAWLQHALSPDLLSTSLVSSTIIIFSNLPTYPPLYLPCCHSNLPHGVPAFISFVMTFKIIIKRNERLAMSLDVDCRPTTILNFCHLRAYTHQFWAVLLHIYISLISLIPYTPHTSYILIFIIKVVA